MKFTTQYIAVGLLAASGVVGCGKEDIKVYSVPKEIPGAANRTALSKETPAEHPPGPVHWTIPAGWKELAPTSLRIGNFLVSSGEKKAEISVLTFPGSVGTELDNVNRWRSEIKLQPIGQSDLSSEDVFIGDEKGKLYDLSGSELQTIAAILHRDGTSWFFKMRGDKEIVSQNKATFVQFLKSLHFHSAAPEPAVAAEKPVSTNVKEIPGEAPSGLPKWEVPASWEEKSPSAMVLKSFSVGTGDQQAIISITRFPGDVGGLLANVNRWRKQLSLEPVAESELSKLTTAIDVLGGKATLVDMKSSDGKTRMIVATVPRNEQTWFYKLMGTEATVAREKEAFEKFVQTVRYPNE